jgi:hypothetical protein
MRDTASLVGNQALATAVDSPGRELDPGLRERFEERLGVDLGDVRVHRGGAAEKAAEAADARAIATGPDVVIGAGEPGPDTTTGRTLLAHELAHVAQWKRAGSTREGWSRPGDAFETQADAVADGAPMGAPPAGAPAAASRQPIDRKLAGIRADALRPIQDLRENDPEGFAQFAAQHEQLMSALLGKYGWKGCWVDTPHYLADFDKASEKWFMTEGIHADLTQIHLEPIQPKKRDETLVMGQLSNGEVYTGPRWAYEQEKEHVYWQRKLQTGENIAGGLGGAVGYGLGGDEGSDLGAAVDGVAQAFGGTYEARESIHASTAYTPERPVAAEVRPAEPAVPRPAERPPEREPAPAQAAPPHPVADPPTAPSTPAPFKSEVDPIQVAQPPKAVEPAPPAPGKPKPTTSPKAPKATGSKPAKAPKPAAAPKAKAPTAKPKAPKAPKATGPKPKEAEAPKATEQEKPAPAPAPKQTTTPKPKPAAAPKAPSKAAAPKAPAKSKPPKAAAAPKMVGGNKVLPKAKRLGPKQKFDPAKRRPNLRQFPTVQPAEVERGDGGFAKNPNARVRVFRQPVSKALTKEHEDMMKRLDDPKSSKQQLGHEYEKLVGRDLTKDGNAPRMSHEAGDKQRIGDHGVHEITIQDLDGAKLDQLWRDLVSSNQVLITVPRLTPEAEQRLAKMAAIFESKTGRRPLIIVRETRP